MRSNLTIELVSFLTIGPGEKFSTPGGEISTILGENQSTFGGRSVYIDHCISENVEKILAYMTQENAPPIARKFLGDCSPSPNLIQLLVE